jgi:beta-glucanase (GH16 family)
MDKKFFIIFFVCFLPIISCNLNDPGEEAQFEDDFNNGQIDESVWQIGTWVEHGGQTGRERCYTEDGYLTLTFINDSEEGYLSSAIQTREEFLYGRWEARLRPSSVPGVLNSMYTIDWDDGNGTKQEIDIEFLTYTFTDNSGEVHFAVHADGFDSFNTNPDIELDFNPSEDFHVWGFEITPDYLEWFVDDEVLLTYTYSENDIAIDSEYQLKFNFWTREQWINGPPEENVECIYLIDWIRFYPYVED